MSFRIDDDDSIKKTVTRVTDIAHSTKRGPVADPLFDLALANNQGLLSKVTKSIADDSYEHAIQWRRLYCLTPCIKSTLMWSHYADKHKGICLEFAVKPGNVFATALKAIYEEEFIQTELYDDSGASLLPFLVKAKCWKHEEEYRLFLHIHDPNAQNPFPDYMRVVNNRFPITEDSFDCNRSWLLYDTRD